MKNGWKFWGEASEEVINLGGFFAKQEEGKPNCYHVVDVDCREWLDGTEGYIITTGYVNTAAQWINKRFLDVMFPAVNLPVNSIEDIRNISIVWLGHRQDFKLMTTYVSNIEGLVEELTNHGITLEVKQ